MFIDLQTKKTNLISFYFKNTAMRFLLFIKFCFICLVSVAQRDVSMVPQGEIRDAFGRAITTKREVGTEGSNYLYDDYKPGRITVKGKTYSGIKIKLNLEKNVVFFEKDGVEMVPSGEVSVVEFMNVATNKYDKKFLKGLPDVNGNDQHTYYEVIDSGKVLLLKHVGIKLRESTVYGDASISRKYEQTKTLYVYNKGEIFHVKRNEDVLNALADKKNDIQTFIAKNKVKANREADLLSVVAYYNQL